jgi:hypothetical protein
MGKKRHNKTVKTIADREKIVLVYEKPQKSRFDIITAFIGLIGVFLCVIAILVSITALMLTMDSLSNREQVKQFDGNNMTSSPTNKPYDANVVINKKVIECEGDVQYSEDVNSQRNACINIIQAGAANTRAMSATETTVPP